MERDDFPPPPPPPDDDEEEGLCFEFDDSADEAPEADRPLPDPPTQDCGPPHQQGAAASAPLGAPWPSLSDIDAPESRRDPRSLSSEDAEADLPRPPPNCPAPKAPSSTPDAPDGDLPPPPEEALTLGWSDVAPGLVPHLPPPPEDFTIPSAQAGCSSLSVASGTTPSQPKVSPYSVIDIAPIQQQVCQQSPPLSPSPSNGNEGEFQEVPSSPSVPSGYSVPVPCGYATPSSVPIITPTYSTPVILRHLSVDEDVSVVGVGGGSDSVFGEGHPAVKEEDALAKWVSDPANVSWMEGPDEVIYDDVPREDTDSTPDIDEMLYDDVECGEEGSSSLDNGWSSSEFESYDETSDHDNSHLHNGLPSAFVRTTSRKTHLSQVLRVKGHYERMVRELMANAVGTVELQQLRHKHEKKVQKLVKAAKHGTKDGLDRTRAAVEKGRSFIRSKSFSQERKTSCFEEEESEVFIEVDCFNVEPVLSPAPEGLSQQQVVRRCILESILESEKNYLDALKRILEQYEKPLLQIEPQLLSRRKCKVAFLRVRDILQCHALFQIALASRVADWDQLQTIGDVFVASFSKSMVLEAYSEYVNNFNTAIGVVRKACSDKPGFLEFLKQRQECSRDRLSLYGLMIKPIQRFPQFILLLQEMLRNTPVGHGDRLPLQMALTELETLAEKLEEKKREADQRCEIKHIAKAMNERYLNKLLSRGTRYLIRSDDVVETVYNDHGEIVKTKERRLFLLSDVLMCATPSMRSPQDGAGGGGVVPSGQRFLLKWSVPLSLVELVEFGSSEEMGDSAPTVYHSVEKVVISAKPNQLYVGPGQLYQDLQNLIHDLGLVNQISTMISSLKGNYQNVNGAVALDWVSGLQRLILKKEEEIRAADRCRIQLQLPGKQDKSGRPTFFSAVFNTFSPSVKQAWISTLQTARLALEEDNVQGWFCAEDDSNLIQKQKHPLLLKHMPVVMSRLQEFKVECAVHIPEPHINYESTADMPAVGHGCVWVASCTNQMGQIAVVAMQNSSPKVTECFNVESRILCMVYVPLDEPLENGQGNPECTVPPRSNDGPTVCVGLEEGSVCVYKSSQRCKKVRLQHFSSPDRAAVTCLAYRSPCLYVGLVSGSLAVFSRTTGGLWDTSSVRLLKLGVLPVKELLVVGGHVWASCGGQVSVISTRTHTVEHQVEVHQEEGMVVSHMVVAGVGIWIAFSSGSTLRLFHTETLEHLQDINVAAPINNVLSGHQRASVSSLLVCHGLLLVGTNLGVTVALSVPRLQGIPKVTGRGMVSAHAHHGPVKFLTAATPVRNLQQVNSAPPTTSPGRPAPVEGAGPSETWTSDGAVWLGEAGSCTGPSPVRRDSLSSSNSSLALSHNSLEHGPEDAAIYDLLRAPARTHGARRAERAEQADVGSLLVVSGGLGHRRVSRKNRQSRHEDATSTVMVWQIPVPSP